MSTLKEFLGCMFEDKPARNQWYRDTNVVYGKIANGFIERDERKDERIHELESQLGGYQCTLGESIEREDKLRKALQKIADITEQALNGR